MWDFFRVGQNLEKKRWTIDIEIQGIIWFKMHLAGFLLRLCIWTPMEFRDKLQLPYSSHVRKLCCHPSCQSPRNRSKNHYRTIMGRIGKKIEGTKRLYPQCHFVFCRWGLGQQGTSAMSLTILRCKSCGNQVVRDVVFRNEDNSGETKVTERITLDKPISATVCDFHQAIQPSLTLL